MIHKVIKQLRSQGFEVYLKQQQLILESTNAPRAVFDTIYRKRIRPSEVSTLPKKRKQKIIVAEYITEATGQRLSQMGFSWADTSGNWELRAKGLLLQRRVPNLKKPETKVLFPKSGPGLAIIRWMIHLPDNTITQTELSQRAKVSQPRVSVILKKLESEGFVQRISRTSWSVSRNMLLDELQDSYQAKDTLKTYYYTVKAPNNAALELVNCVGKSNALITGETAADLLAPWQKPTKLTAYRLNDWTKVPKGWIEVDSVDKSNITIIDSSDLSVQAWTPVLHWKSRKLTIADPTQVLWDFINRDNGDEIEATEELRKWIISHPILNFD